MLKFKEVWSVVKYFCKYLQYQNAVSLFKFQINQDNVKRKFEDTAVRS